MNVKRMPVTDSTHFGMKTYIVEYKDTQNMLHKVEKMAYTFAGAVAQITADESEISILTIYPV